MAKSNPHDEIGNSVYVMRIATGEVEDRVEDDGKNVAAVALELKRGKHL